MYCAIHWTSHCMCFRACRKGCGKMLLSDLWAILGATPGYVILSQHLSHAYACTCRCSAQVKLVKRFCFQKHTWFLFYICSGFVFCSCIFTHAANAATAWWLLLTSFCHWQLWQLLCEHTPDELTASCFLPSIVWGWRHGLCFISTSFALLCALPYTHWGGYHGCGTQSWTGRASACLSALRMVLGQNLLLYKLLLWLCHCWMKFWEAKPLFTGVAVALWSPMIAVHVGRWLGGLRREGSFAVLCCKHCSKHCSCREA